MRSDEIEKMERGKSGRKLTNPLSRRAEEADDFEKYERIY